VPSSLRRSAEVEADQQLVGWKAIATSLGVSVRTAQRWRADEGMPVQFQRHTRGHTAMASVVALRQWRSGERVAAMEPPTKPTEPMPRFRTPDGQPVPCQRVPCQPSIMIQFTRKFRRRGRMVLWIVMALGGALAAWDLLRR
jgi:hypothetical protein